jgi:hypothetical protein
MKTTLVIFMAAIAVVHMEPQWPLLQPTVPYVYGTYPTYHQVRVVPVVPKTKSVAPKKPISLKPKTYSLDYLSSEGCEVVDFIQRELRYLDSLFRVCDRDDDGIQTYEWYNPSCEDYFFNHYDDQTDFDDLDINYDGSITYREVLRAIEFFDSKPDECY